MHFGPLISFRVICVEQDAPADRAACRSARPDRLASARLTLVFHVRAVLGIRVRLKVFLNTGWAAQDDAPGEVLAITQTDDGRLGFFGPTDTCRLNGIRVDLVGQEASASEVG